jgi:hypothetical protein
MLSANRLLFSGRLRRFHHDKKERVRANVHRAQCEV